MEAYPALAMISRRLLTGGQARERIRMAILYPKHACSFAGGHFLLSRVWYAHFTEFIGDIAMRKLKLAMQFLLGAFFVLAGLNHFRVPEFYVSIMPRYLPWHEQLVNISGVCEIVLGLLLVVPRYTVAASWGIIALLIAVFPANIHMAMNPNQYPDVSPMLLWLRLPLQVVMIAWAYWFTQTPAAIAAVDRVVPST
jgi:uncharacterized membrane protein